MAVTMSCIAMAQGYSYNKNGECIRIRESSNGRYGLYNERQGKYITPCKYDYNTFYNHNIALRDENYKYGVYNDEGKLIIPFIYSYLGDVVCFGEKPNADYLYVAQRDGYTGIINDKNQIIAPFRYDYINRTCRDGMLAAKNKNGKYGVIDYHGNIIIDFRYDKLSLRETGDCFGEADYNGVTYFFDKNFIVTGKNDRNSNSSSSSSSSGSTIGAVAGIVAIGAAIYGLTKLFSDDSSSGSSSSSSYNDLSVSASDIQSTNSYCTLNDLHFYGWKGENYDYSVISLKNGHDYNLFRLRNTSSSSRYFIYVYDIGGKKSPTKKYYATSRDAVDAIEKMDCRFCKWFKNKKGRNATYLEFSNWKNSNL